MAKFYGKIGYETQVERPADSGVWVVDVVEKEYCGDILQYNRRIESGDKINDDVVISNRFSIIADPYALENMYCMRYIIWGGAKWKITTIEAQYPRLILSIGGLYNG